MKLLICIGREAIELIVIILIIMAFVGYIEAEWPWMPEHGSREWVETVYWADK